MEDEISAEAVYAVPWFRDALEQASALTGTGIDAQTALLAAVALPVVLKVLQLVSPYVETHAKDLQGAVHIAKLEQMAQLREKHGPEVFSEVVEAIDRQEQTAIAARSAGVKAKK